MNTIKRPKAGLVPFYLKLYDDLMPECRAGFDCLINDITTSMAKRGIDICAAPICRVSEEFENAIIMLEKENIDCLLTVHLAYSPSLESIDSFCRTKLPIVIMDTTMDADFDIGVSPDRIMYNHGVHGVMDFASMLLRRGRHFEITAGHIADDKMLDTTADLIRAATAAGLMGKSKMLRVSNAFAGMGDFTVCEDVMAEKLGITVNQISLDTLDESVAKITDDQVSAEVASDHAQFECVANPVAHEQSVRVGLGLRAIIDEGDYSGFSVNFQAFDRCDRPANTMPFMEISKAMGRGIGYAGEGDVLTAALVGALTRAFNRVTFTEIFCPDWAGDSLFLSHMGEISPSIASGKPRIISKPFFSGGSLDPAILTCAAKPGPAVFVNLAPGPNNSFSLIVAPVEVLAENDSLDSAILDTIRIWVKPQGSISTFLEAYSRAGGTHHSALVLGNHVKAIAAFGHFCGLNVVQIEG